MPTNHFLPPVQPAPPQDVDDHATDQETGADHQHADDQHGDEQHGDEHAAGPEGDDHSGDLTDHYLGRDHLLLHVQDSDKFELPGGLGEDGRIAIKIPHVSPWTEEKPLVAAPTGEAHQFLGPVTFQPTKFILLEFGAALIVATLFIWLGRKVKNGDAPKGRLWNMLEACVIYIRDEIAKPAIGSHDAARYLPFLLTVFFFVLAMNLMGMFPLFGTPTGNISITSSLALVVFAIVMFSGMKRLGVIGFWKNQVPQMDLPKAMALGVIPMVWSIEVFGLFIKHMVLSVRLFANMFAGHLVLAVFVGFIGVTFNSLLVWGVIPISVGASVAIGLLEILVALIQAYVFTFLSALFIGAAIHEH